MSESYWITADKVICSESSEKRWIEIRDQKFVSIQQSAPPSAVKIFDFGQYWLFPGIVDTHVHVNEPGRTNWEGFDTATKAAASGGATTLIDMPLNCIPVTTSRENFLAKLESLSHKLSVDVGFWGGITSDNLLQVENLLSSGVLGVKSFLIDSGIPEFPPIRIEQLEDAMSKLAKFDLPYLFHAELDQGETKDFEQDLDYESFLRSRPESWEVSAIEKIIFAAKKTKCRVHIVHLSSAAALSVIQAARRDGVNISVETCPHYLLFSSEEVPSLSSSSANLFKCCPPIRNHENQKLLWSALERGAIDMIVSDHSPCTPDLKKLGSINFKDAWGGISSLQFSFSLIFTEVLRRNLSITKIVQWMSKAPAAMAGLENKGDFKVGKDADFFVFDSSLEWRPDPASTFHRNKISPYYGRVLRGKVVKTFLRGNLIFQNGLFEGIPCGQAILK